MAGLHKHKLNMNDYILHIFTHKFSDLIACFFWTGCHPLHFHFIFISYCAEESAGTPSWFCSQKQKKQVILLGLTDSQWKKREKNVELVEKCRKQEWHVLGLPNEAGEEALLKSCSVRCTVPWESQWNTEKILQDSFRENPHYQKGQTGQTLLGHRPGTAHLLLGRLGKWIWNPRNPGTITDDVPEKVLHKMHLITFIWL